MLTTEIWGFAYPEVGDPPFVINLFYILAVVLIRNLIPHRRRTMSPYGLFSYVARIISGLESTMAVH